MVVVVLVCCLVYLKTYIFGGFKFLCNEIDILNDE